MVSVLKPSKGGLLWVVLGSCIDLFYKHNVRIDGGCVFDNKRNNTGKGVQYCCMIDRRKFLKWYRYVSAMLRPEYCMIMLLVKLDHIRYKNVCSKSYILVYHVR